MATLRVEVNGVMVDLPAKEKIKEYKYDLLELLKLPATTNEGQTIPYVLARKGFEGGFEPLNESLSLQKLGIGNNAKLIFVSEDKWIKIPHVPEMTSESKPESVQTEVATGYCEKCGVPLTDGATVCSACDVSSYGETNSDDATGEKVYFTSKWKVLPYIITGIFAIATLVFFVAFISGEELSHTEEGMTFVFIGVIMAGITAFAALTMFKNHFTITDKRVYGSSLFGVRFTVPTKHLVSVYCGALGGFVLCDKSGKTRYLVKGANDAYDVLAKLLVCKDEE